MDSTKILVVDDDVNIAELLRLYLEKDGFSVVTAENGAKAIELHNRENPDLILLDIMLPIVDGWQVCREIRKTSNVPIIMVTAKGETFDKVLGLELGADDYVVKPFDTKEILEVSVLLISYLATVKNRYLIIYSLSVRIFSIDVAILLLELPMRRISKPTLFGPFCSGIIR